MPELTGFTYVVKHMEDQRGPLELLPADIRAGEYPPYALSSKPEVAKFADTRPWIVVVGSRDKPLDQRYRIGYAFRVTAIGEGEPKLQYKLIGERDGDCLLPPAPRAVADFALLEWLQNDRRGLGINQLPDELFEPLRSALR